VFRLKYGVVAAKHAVYGARPDCTAYSPTKPGDTMKIYRLITLAAAVLINVLIARALIDEKVGAAPALAQAATAEAEAP
jgi:hypothetical protein